MKKLKFIDLFAGLGGFHLGLQRLGHKCVYACEIDSNLNQIYQKKFNMKVDYDICNVNLKTIPKYDILCAGFPCQPFSKAGTQSGFNHKIAGNMFNHILRFIKAHKPKYLFLENVPNLEKHNKGKTWKLMKRKLEKEGYNIEQKNLSPLHFKIPQIRFRMYILGIRTKRKKIKIIWPELKEPKMTIKRKTNIAKYLKSKPAKPRNLTKEKKYLLRMWEDFLSRIPKINKNNQRDKKDKILIDDQEYVKIYNPLWISEFGATYPFEDTTPSKMGPTQLKKYRGTLGVSLKNKSKEKIFEFIPPYARYSRSINESKRESRKFPDWKIKFIKDLRNFYKVNKKWIDPWLKKYKKPKYSMANEPTHRKFEWNCKGEKYTLEDKIISFRGSGLRVKRMDAAPTLIHAAITQLPYIPQLKRYLSIEECLKIQGLREIIPILRKKNYEMAYSAIGNAVNADVVQKIAKSFLK